MHVDFWTDEANLTAMLTDGNHLDVNRADDRRAISEATREMVEGLASVAVFPGRHA